MDTEKHKNIIQISLILTEIGLKKFKTIPTFNRTLKTDIINKLVVGENKLSVNHYIYSVLERLSGYDSNNIQVKKIVYLS